MSEKNSSRNSQDSDEDNLAIAPATASMMPSAPPDPNEQWLASTLSLRSALQFDTRSENGKPFVVIEDPVRSKYFQVGLEEYDFISLLDGKKSANQIVEELGRLNDNSISSEQAVTICQWLVQSNLVISEALDSSARLGNQATAIDKQK